MEVSGQLHVLAVLPPGKQPPPPPPPPPPRYPLDGRLAGPRAGLDAVLYFDICICAMI